MRGRPGVHETSDSEWPSDGPESEMYMCEDTFLASPLRGGCVRQGRAEESDSDSCVSEESVSEDSEEGAAASNVLLVPGTVVEVHCTSAGGWVVGWIAQPARPGRLTVHFELQGRLCRKHLLPQSTSLRCVGGGLARDAERSRRASERRSLGEVDPCADRLPRPRDLACADLQSLVSRRALVQRQQAPHWMTAARAAKSQIHAVLGLARRAAGCSADWAKAAQVQIAAAAKEAAAVAQKAAGLAAEQRAAARREREEGLPMRLLRAPAGAETEDGPGEADAAAAENARTLALLQQAAVSFEQTREPFHDDTAPRIWYDPETFSGMFCPRRASYASVHDIDPQAPWRLFRGAPRGDDVAQGLVGSCWLLATLSALADHSGGDLVKALFPDAELQRPDGFGAYLVRLCVPSRCERYTAAGKSTEHQAFKGSWRYILLDDRLPSLGRDLWFYADTPNHVLWVSLLEKAMAKVKGGSYECLHGGQPASAFFCLTGCRTMRYFIDRWKRKDDLWNTLEYALRSGWLATATSRYDPREGSRHLWTVAGLTGNPVRTGDADVGERSLQLRNPHGGRHGRESPHRQLDWDGFLREFNEVTVCEAQAATV